MLLLSTEPLLKLFEAPLGRPTSHFKTSVSHTNTGGHSQTFWSFVFLWKQFGTFWLLQASLRFSIWRNVIWNLKITWWNIQLLHTFTILIMYALLLWWSRVLWKPKRTDGFFICFILTAHLDPYLCRVPYQGCRLLLPRSHRALAWKKKYSHLVSCSGFSQFHLPNNLDWTLLRNCYCGLFYLKNTSNTVKKKKKVFQDQYWKVKYGYRKKMVVEKSKINSFYLKFSGKKIIHLVLHSS